MDIINQIIKKILMEQTAPQMIGLSQLKQKNTVSVPDGPSLRRKDVKLSDLMRRVS